jgi:hypothetical protein
VSIFEDRSSVPVGIEVSIDIEAETVTSMLNAFGRDAPGILDKTLANTSAAYRRYLRSNFLSGQMLAERTGFLKKSVRYKKARGKKHEYIISAVPKLANIYEHAGGSDIVPSAKRILAFPANPSIDTSKPGWWLGLGKGEVIFARNIHHASRPFMTRSSSSFNFAAAFDTAFDKVIEKELKKRGFDE